MKNITQTIKIVGTALVLSVGISYVSAWTAPTVTPPNGNVAAPVNISNTAQYKSGALGVGGLIRGYSDAIFDGKVGIGTASPERALHIASPGGMTAGLVTDPYSAIYDANGVRFNRNNESYIDQSTVGGWLSFRTSNVSTVDTTAVTMKANGNVGIGTTVPNQKLSVAGIVESTSGGIKFPDGSVQLKAASGGNGTISFGTSFVPLSCNIYNCLCPSGSVQVGVSGGSETTSIGQPVCSYISIN